MRNKREIILNDISIKEISSILTKIDEQIIDLHNCSSDDFMGLYTDFKKFYTQSKNISDNANEIFKLLSEDTNKNLFSDLQNLYKDLNCLQDQSKQNLNNTNSSYTNLKALLEQLFIPIKNLKQNLSTLKFLIANINLNDFNLSSKEEKVWDDIITQNNTIIDEYRDRCLLSEKKIFSLEVEIGKSIKVFDTYYKSNINDLDNLLNNIHFGILFFEEKHEEVKRQIPELTAKTEKNSQSIADIVTNLQYQDIIRQKIEHIQQTHKKILSELYVLYEVSGSDPQKEVHLLQKIKDIAGLQAAILVSANKEYQLAIEKITKKFIELGGEMVNITSICSRLNNYQVETDEIHLTGMLNLLNNSEQILTDFIERSNSYYKQVKSDTITLKHTIEGLNYQLRTEQNFFKSKSDLFSLFSKNENQDSSIKTTLTHIHEVCEDIHKFEQSIDTVFSGIVRNDDILSAHIKDYNESLGKNKLVNNSARSINSIINQLEAKSIRIGSLLENNIKQSKDTPLEIQESIKRIRYYDLFEKSISSIISDLNEIHLKLKGGVSDETRRKEVLNEIKKLYTMETEHEIHDRIALKKDDDLFLVDLKKAEKRKTKNSDEVELF